MSVVAYISGHSNIESRVGTSFVNVPPECVTDYWLFAGRALLLGDHEESKDAMTEFKNKSKDIALSRWGCTLLLSWK